MNSLESILSEEEKTFLNSINAKYKKHIDEEYNEQKQKTIDELASDGGPDPFNIAEPPKHITNYQREILVKTIAEISTINEQGRLTSVDVCLENLYHIPVPPDTDYTKLLDEFVQIFDKEITHCAKKIVNNNERPN